MTLFYFIIITLFFTFSLAFFLAKREERAKKDIQRDIRSEWYKNNHIDKK